MNDRLLLSCLGLASLAAIFAACFLGSTPMPPGRLFAAMVGAGSVGDHIVLWEIRLPRAIAAFIVGGALGLCGAALQGLLRNPLAEPGVLGVSAFSALGATLALFYGAAALSPFVLPLSAIAGALAATFFLAFAAIRNSSMVTLILIGIGLSSFAGALMALLLNLAPNPFSLSDLISWTLGSVANRSFADLALAGPFLGAGLIFIVMSGRGLTALSLGEEAAHGLGVNLRRTRMFVVIGTGLITGAAVSIAGAIGFVGIVAPHLIRPLVNHDPARTLAPAAFLGGILLVLADIGVRLIPTPSELRLGVLAALIGAPAFIWIASQRRTGS
ncbi:MAG: ABC transporter permease [Hyphococcus sp.]|nr:MAG: ABC transporter permease [Marinicaulis sp.]